jgi:hypothetical protein
MRDLDRLIGAQPEPDRRDEEDAEDGEEERQEGDPFQLTTPGTASVNGEIAAWNDSPPRVRMV